MTQLPLLSIFRMADLWIPSHLVVGRYMDRIKVLGLRKFVDVSFAYLISMLSKADVACFGANPEEVPATSWRPWELDGRTLLYLSPFRKIFSCRLRQPLHGRD
jgi:hypothetical protein